MKSVRLALIAPAVAMLTAFGAPAAQADPAAPMFETGVVYEIGLGLSAEEEAALEAEPGEYVKGTLTAARTDGTPGEVTEDLTPTPLNVEIKLKGSVGGSFRPLTGKAGFKVKFKKEERLLGLKKLTLNNMVEDPSMIHEALAYKAFRDAGVPAPRTGYAYVRLNGNDYGLYANIETPDDLWLEKQFGSFDDEAQHLYEGEHGVDVVPGDATEFSVDEGDDADIGDLEALIAAVNGSGSPWIAQVAPHADLQEMAWMWAVGKFIGFWDGYAGRIGENGNQPNNYYLFSEPDGRFQMFPWGTDETWFDRLDFGGHAGVMFDKCLADESCARIYWETLTALRESFDPAEMDQLAADLASLLEPWEEMDPRKEVFSMAQIETEVGEARDFIAGRPAEADAWLAANVPPEPEWKPFPIAMPPPEGAEPREEPQTPLDAVRLFKGDGAFSTRLRLNQAATVRQWGAIATRDGRRSACQARARAEEPGVLVLHCRLNATTRHRLQRRWLRIVLTTRIRGADGTSETLTRRVRLPRTPR